MSAVIGIYGASGFGREVLPVLQHSATPVVFIDDRDECPSEVAGVTVLGWDDFCVLPAGAKSVTIAIADAAVRRRLAARCAGAGVAMHSVRAPNAWIADDAEIGEGAIFQPFVNITANARIGRCFHANIYSYVAHDCVIGDFVTFAPHVMCNGNVHIDDDAYIGTGAILRQGGPDKPLRIGAGAVVGMGAVVTKDVPPGVTVIGNPARPLVRD